MRIEALIRPFLHRANTSVYSCQCTNMQRMATAADYSPVQAALSLSFSYLVNSIDATALLPEALSRQLITERQRSECASEPDSYKKAEKFLGHLQRTVNGDSSKFHTFVKVLEETNHTNIASRLRGSLQLASSFLCV